MAKDYVRLELRGMKYSLSTSFIPFRNVQHTHTTPNIISKSIWHAKIEILFIRNENNIYLLDIEL